MAEIPSANITINQGFDFSKTFVSRESDGSASNLTGFTGKAQIKKHPDTSTSKSFSITITAATGQVAIAMTSGVTSGITPGRYLYDVKLTSSAGAVSRLTQGTALVVAGITT